MSAKVITNADFDVTKLNKGNVSYFWDGWRVGKHIKTGGAWASRTAIYHNGGYGKVEYIEANDKGEWHL